MRSAIVLSMLVLGTATVGCRPGTSSASEGSNTPQAAPTANGTADTGPAASRERPASARWCVLGRVTDAGGAPLEEVEIVAHCGAGTLQRTGRALTDTNGEYELWFGPGRMTMRDASGLQAATISPHKPGMVERHLHRQGDLLMAKRPPDDGELRAWGEHKSVVLPGKAQRVDFVMLPAAAISGRLVDGDGKPITDHYISVDAEQLPPSSSVLATMKTDSDGGFQFGELPAGTVWLAMRTPEDVMQEVRSKTLRCEAGKAAEVQLVYESGPPARLTLHAGKAP
jgi:hypothetical protein